MSALSFVQVYTKVTHQETSGTSYKSVEHQPEAIENNGQSQEEHNDS